MKRLLCLGALALVGCTTQLGQFTVYAPEAIDLSTGAYAVDRTRKVTGTDPCTLYFLYASPDAPSYDQVVRCAMAQRPGCVGLADVTLTRKAFWFLFGYCDFTAEGYPIIRKEVP